ncbi:hypothetical protein ACLB2K_039112 [Fragaria x ananassa]
MHNPSEDHMNAVMRILRYLKSAPEKGLMFCKHGHLRTSGYTDADWAWKITDMRSTSGYFTFVGGFKLEWSMPLHCDNTVVVEIAHNPIQHDRTKHVEIDRHFIKEKLDSRIISFSFHSEEQLADIFTKVVSSRAFSDSLDKLVI